MNGIYDTEYGLCDPRSNHQRRRAEQSIADKCNRCVEDERNDKQESDAEYRPDRNKPRAHQQSQSSQAGPQFRRKDNVERGVQRAAHTLSFMANASTVTLGDSTTKSNVAPGI
ncbi:MAG TPA: hypothetical protein VF534_18455 [Paraburkholderia sp.]